MRVVSSKKKKKHPNFSSQLELMHHILICPCHLGDTNLTSRISAALVDGKYVDAVVLLAEMRIRNETPKLGALCRWVRDLDVTSGLSMTGASETKSRPELLRVMDAILRATDPVDFQSDISSCLNTTDPIVLQKVWDLRDANQEPLQIRASVLDKTIFQSCPADIQSRFRVLERTAGSERKPPNLHDAILFLSENDAVDLSPTSPPITHYKHPVVPNLSLMKGVLSPDECKAIIAATESVGFLPDAPIKADGSDASILAHNVYWIADQAFHDKLWQRVYPFIQKEVAGKKARSINRRFRVYRYIPGAEYRCHFDGAWPPSGIHPVTGKYVWDSSPAEAKQSSLYTFLVYLNDEFEGGETTFFMPSVKEGVMNAHRVRPVIGSIALFPHGEGNGALLHEGTGVRKGAKYIIRTDVEYDISPGKPE
jgi:hypothetical protein